MNILELLEDPISVNDISARSGYSKISIYRRIPDLLDISMLITVGREKDQKIMEELAQDYMRNHFMLQV